MLKLINVIDTYVRGYAELAIPGTKLMVIDGGYWIHFGNPINNNVTDEIFVFEDEIDNIQKMTASYVKDSRHLVTIISRSANIIHSSWDAKYELETAEHLMKLTLRKDEVSFIEPMIKKVVSTREINKINGFYGSQLFFPPHLSNPKVEIFYLEKNDRILSWGALVHSKFTSYIGKVFTIPEYRRQGFAKMLMQGMIQKAIWQGVGYNILASTNSGFNLYKSLGYQGILLVSIYKSKG